MEISYMELISPEPFYVDGIGIKSPKLKKINKIKYSVYSLYIDLFVMTPYEFLKMQNIVEVYENLEDEAKVHLTMFDLVLESEYLQKTYTQALNFFVSDHVIYNAELKCFDVFKTKKEETIMLGHITRDNWADISQLILERNYIKSSKLDTSKIKNKRALEIAIKMQKAREKKSSNKSADLNYELGNIISALVAYKDSINYINIWDYTIYQLRDAFHRQFNKIIYDRVNTSTAIWGDKNNHFKLNSWFENIKTDN